MREKFNIPTTWDHTINIDWLFRKEGEKKNSASTGPPGI